MWAKEWFSKEVRSESIWKGGEILVYVPRSNLKFDKDILGEKVGLLNSGEESSQKNRKKLSFWGRVHSKQRIHNEKCAFFVDAQSNLEGSEKRT